MICASLEDIIACPSLPTLPAIAVELLERTRDPDVDIAEIASLVESDPGLASRILRIVNSSLYGLRSPCTSIHRALTFLGLNAVKSLVLGFSLAEMTRDNEEADSAFDFREFWKNSIFSAVAARQLASHIKVCDPDDAFTGGMFQNMGMFAAYSALGDPYVELVRESQGQHAQLIASEREAMGFTNYHAAAALSKKWNFPDTLVGCIRNIPDPDQADDSCRAMTRTVALGRMLVELMENDDPQDQLTRLQSLMHHWFDQECDDLSGVLHSISETAISLAKVLEKDIGTAPDLEVIRGCAELQNVEFQLAIQREVEELRQSQIELTSAALTDGLTGVWNRKKFNDDVMKAFEESATLGQPVSVMFIDADKFKLLNDCHGHQIGDAVLIEIAHRLHTSVGTSGSVYRYGGEEFIILIQGWDQERAVRFAEVVRNAIATPQFDVTETDPNVGRLAVTVSIGVSSWNPNQADSPAQSFDPARTVREADEALYQAKHDGRNCVRAFSPDDQNRASIPTAQPIDTHGSAPAPMKPRVDSSADKDRILLIENDPLVEALLRTVLTRNVGLEVHCVNTVQKAIGELTEGKGVVLSPPKIIICERLINADLGMDVLNAIRHDPRLTDVPFMMITDRSTPEFESTTLEAGATRICTKQFIASNMPQWVKDIQDLIGEAATKRSAA